MSILTLAIESAIRGGSIAVLKDEDVIANWNGDTSISKAEDLLPTIAEMLKVNDLKLKDIGQIAVSVGPGSFTGIRIGISTAMGLADSTGIETFGISSLAAIVNNAAARTAVVPVGKNDIAWQTFYALHTGEIIIGSIEDLLKAKPEDTIFNASLLDEHRQAITESFGEISDARICTNAAIEIGKYAITHPEKHLPLEPIYVQNPRYVSTF